MTQEAFDQTVAAEEQWLAEIESNAAFLSQMLGGEWRIHPATNNYFFSKEGHAARVTQRKGKRMATILKGCSCGRGYRAISYPLGNGRYGRIYIHRGVCELFNGPCPDGMECRHLDGNIHNNRASNLCWGTPQENSDDKQRHGTVAFGEANPNSKLTAVEVAEMRRLREERKTPYYKLAKEFNVSTMTAFRAATGRNWK